MAATSAQFRKSPALNNDLAQGAGVTWERTNRGRVENSFNLRKTTGRRDTRHFSRSTQFRNPGRNAHGGPIKDADI